MSEKRVTFAEGAPAATAAATAGSSSSANGAVSPRTPSSARKVPINHGATAAQINSAERVEGAKELPPGVAIGNGCYLQGLAKQDLATLDVAKLTPLTPEVISRQATINIGTIGHVAHGKSTVVKAISGVKVRCNRRRERGRRTHCVMIW